MKYEEVAGDLRSIENMKTKDVNRYNKGLIREKAGVSDLKGHVLEDQLIQFIRKPLDFEFAFRKAEQYVKSEKAFVRRWGYVIFLAGLQKDEKHTKEILSLMKDDDEYYVQMAEAWVICDLAVYNVKDVYEFLKKSKIKYNILGKAIQKSCDSFRVSKEDKEKLKALREKLKRN